VVEDVGGIEGEMKQTRKSRSGDILFDGLAPPKKKGLSN